MTPDASPVSSDASAPVSSAYARLLSQPYTLHFAAILSGLCIACCFLWFDLFPLAWVAFTPLLWALHHTATYKEAAQVGFVAGLATNIPAFYWMVYTVHVFGGFPYPIAVGLYAALSCYSALQFVLFALALHRSGPGPLALAAPVIWVALEFCYPNLFPWRMAHTQLSLTPLLQVGDLTGPYGLSVAVVWVAAAVGQLLSTARNWRPLLGALVLTSVLVLYGVLRLPTIEAAMRTAPSLRVALIQGNLGIEEKGDMRYFNVNLETYQRISAEVQDAVDLIIWPETVSQHWVHTDLHLLRGELNPFPALQTHLLFGGLAYRPIGPQQVESFNSSFLLAPGGIVHGRYDKHILMPFGEYIPFASYFPFLQDLSPESGSFAAGTGVTLFPLPNDTRIGPLICYEDLLAPMARASARAGAEVLVNILNDAWYGESAAPYQHQALALWRAVETRRFLLRGSNSGVTSVIDAAGRIQQASDLFEVAVLTAVVPRLNMHTVYTRFGDVFAWGLVLGTLGLLAWRRRD